MRYPCAPGALLALTVSAGALAACSDTRVSPAPLAGGDPGRGRTVVAELGCGACHIVPGVSWPRGRVGPSLEGFGARSLIAGRYPNQPPVLIQWVRDAPSLSPRTGMPAIPMTEQEARDVAAYLYTLDAR
ncbi:c-type cytochrome [Phenylobacterium sp.]|uniref:c-type cytochrome n=1 Tax=Phenylobacterium sp. TaxID=1871053 RepID=UPI0035B213C0